jgi:glycosyltransferase involved in cell wall biosynthesis
MNNNLVSVILPVFNAEIYLEEAIRSVLSQTYKNLELICINDLSTDNSLSLLESFGNDIVLVNNEVNCGTAESRNKGIRLARGNFLSFLDNDDIWKNDKLEIQLNQFQHTADLDVSVSHMQCFLSPEMSEEAKMLLFCPPDPLPGYIPSTIVVKRTSFEKVGYFDRRWKNGESIAWILKAQEAGLHFGMVEDVLVKRRIHERNKGILSSSVSKSEYLKIFREAVHRRRKGIDGRKHIESI